MPRILKKAFALLNGLFTVLKYGLKKRVTLEYPEKKQQLPKNFRGKLTPARNNDGELTCIGCELCVKNCPVNNVIQIQKEKDENGKIKVISYDIDHSRCIFCGNCIYVCPYQHIKMSNEYELATTSLETLVEKNRNTLENDL